MRVVMLSQSRRVARDGERVFPFCLRKIRKEKGTEGTRAGGRGATLSKKGTGNREKGKREGSTAIRGSEHQFPLVWARKEPIRQSDGRHGPDLAGNVASGCHTAIFSFFFF